MGESQKEDAKRGAKTSRSQQIAIIAWLEVEKNRNLINGAAQQDVGKVTAGAKLKKTDAYADLADHVNSATGSK